MVERNQLVAAAKKAVASEGYELERVPCRGLSSIWKMTKQGKTRRACIRTTRDRWVAFPPLADGKRWKTLDDVETVIIASVDDPHDPTNVEVFMVPAVALRKRFSAAYSARKKAGSPAQDNFGMWVAIDLLE